MISITQTKEQQEQQEGQPLSPVLFSVHELMVEGALCAILLKGEIVGGSIEPATLTQIQFPRISLRNGIILSLRGPIWLHQFISHFYHPCLWFGSWDPRLGAVVTASHSGPFKPGDVVNFDVLFDFLK